MIDKQTGEWAPVPRFVDIPQLVRDTQRITDAARGRGFSSFMMALALLKNYRPSLAPSSLGLRDIIRKFDKTYWTGGEERAKETYGSFGPERTYEDALKRRQDRWNFMFIGGMWFQDLFNYDFRRTEMCIIPHATQQGEISFCAYNTGIGWRKIIENMYKNATVAEWYKTHGKHQIYAKGKKVELESYAHSLKVDPADAARVKVRTHDVPTTAGEEERARRKAAWEAQQARQYYEELVMKNPPRNSSRSGMLSPCRPRALITRRPRSASSVVLIPQSRRKNPCAYPSVQENPQACPNDVRSDELCRRSHFLDHRRLRA